MKKLNKETVKTFWKKNKRSIITIGGIGAATVGTLLIFICKTIEKDDDLTIADIPTPPIKDNDPYRNILEGFGAVYEEGSYVPLATREVVEKFLDERGDTYQIDILDDDTSVVWISGAK